MVNVRLSIGLALLGPEQGRNGCPDIQHSGNATMADRVRPMLRKMQSGVYVSPLMGEGLYKTDFIIISPP